MDCGLARVGRRRRLFGSSGVVHESKTGKRIALWYAVEDKGRSLDGVSSRSNNIHTPVHHIAQPRPPHNTTPTHSI